MSTKSKTWDYFKKAAFETATCNKCGISMQTKGGNTKGMINHLNLVHDIQISKLPVHTISNDTTDEPISSVSSTSKKQNLRESLDEILAKCAAVDGFSFRGITNSEAIRGYVVSRNYQMPKHPMTTQKLVMEFSNEKKNELKQQLIEKIRTNQKFSITVDEWTNNSCVRFINVTLHSADSEIFNLGLTKIDGSCDAAETIRLVDSTLTGFGINLNEDIVASTHDGEAVMVKYGNVIEPENQLCFNHAIHLEVVKVFYSKTTRLTAPAAPTPEPDVESEFDDCSDEDSDNINFNGGDIVQSVNDNEDADRLEISEEFGVVINETRRICKFFKMSPLRNAILQKFVVEKHGKNLKLTLDVL